MKKIRCAIYTRKSSDDGLDKEFNTLEAQREACENYIKSQVHQGWEIINTIYDDGGFSGGNMNRPAFQSLLKDIEAKKIDMIVVYKIDRLTRSLTDFSKMIEVFDKNDCSFVSVTQSFNTADSMGRLMLNVLLSFAQFEREVSGERIRDKIKASRAKGMWTGGVVPFGYQVIDKKLIINQKEAETIRTMYTLYLRHKSTIAVANLLSDAGHKMFRKDLIRRMLTNPIYIGKIKHKTDIHDGQHEAIVDEDIFNKVQKTITSKNSSQRSCLYKKNEVGLLRSILKCGCCDTSMTPSCSQTRGVRRYYYTSTKAKYYGTKHCHNGSIPVPILDKCILKIISPCLSDIKVLHTILQEIDNDQVVKITKKPNKIIEKMSELEKSLMIKLLIKEIKIHYDTIGGGAAFKGEIRIDSNRTLSITVGKGGNVPGPIINPYNRPNADGESGGLSQIEGMVICNGGRGGMYAAVRNNVAPGGTYQFLTPEIIISTIVAGNGNNGGPGDMNAPAYGANSKLTGDGGGKPHGGAGTSPGAGGAGTTLGEIMGGNGANGIVRLTYKGKLS